MSEAASEPNKSVETKKGKGKLVGILVALALILGAGAAGAVLAPKYLAKAPQGGEHAKPEGEAESEKADEHEKEPEKGAEEEEEEEEAPRKKFVAVHEVKGLESMVVDSRSATGEIRHIKVGLAIELPEGLPEAEFGPYIPRAREAAIGYFRTRDFEQLSDPKNFPQVVKDLNKEIQAAIGKKRMQRVVITDFVAQ